MKALAAHESAGFVRPLPPTDKPRRLSCVVPAFNEAANLALLLPALRETLHGCAREWEVIVVDDGSRDGTPAVLEAWSREPGFRTITLSRNFGKEAALMAGLQAAGGDVVVTMDADMQHPPQTIPSLLRAWRGGAQVVYALRSHRGDESRAKRWGTRLFYALLNVGDRFSVPPDAGDFRLMDRRVVDALLALPERNRFMKGLYAWVGFETVAVPYDVAPRASGRTSFGLRQLARLSLVGLTAFTTWPLRAVSVAGVALALLAIGYGCFVTVSYFVTGNEVSGWTTLVVGLALLSGVQLISLGVVGEYVGRVFEEVKGRPLYVVKHSAGQSFEARAAARQP
jgi:glycosyltransferase involved in cell wall biosynthesis